MLCTLQCAKKRNIKDNIKQVEEKEKELLCKPIMKIGEYANEKNNIFIMKPIHVIFAHCKEKI